VKKKNLYLKFGYFLNAWFCFLVIAIHIKKVRKKKEYYLFYRNIIQAIIM